MCGIGDILYDFTYTGGTADAASFYWEFGPDATPPVSTEQDPEGVLFGSPGLQEVTLTITRYGCSNTVTKMVDIPQISCGSRGRKVLMCHIPPGNPANSFEICVSPQSVNAHLAHGDICGPCADNNYEEAMSRAGGFDTALKAYPNPFSTYATVESAAPLF